ncbi:PAS domain-containing sensor histidine kinase [Inquilinus sp. CAU 1745]|uniref:sensor histidine kinase n=1 Tax=Inquilinus sp. CAU 1745 TaxID=3140369 RepID=UPI00325B9332
MRARVAELEALAAEQEERTVALQASEQLYRSLIENLRSIIFYRGAPDGDVHLFGADAQKIAGTLAPDGKANLDWWYGAIHPEDYDRYMELESRRKETGEGFLIEFRFIHPISGQLVWARERAYTVTSPTGERFNDGYIIDISREKAQERQLTEATEAAILANRSKSEFLANMSHELRTPLNAIIGFAEIIVAESFGPIGVERYREYIRDIHNSASHLLKLIEDVLDVSKAEAGKAELRETLCDMGGIVNSAIRMIHDRAERKRIRIVKDIAPRVPQIRADERKMRQILLNLLSNAVKFTGEGGAVRIHAVDRPDGGVTIIVSDTGIGMAPDDIPRALEPFVQIHAGLDRYYEGTGLGLPLTAKLVELHGGTLDIASTPGAGTEIRVNLPPDRSTPPPGPG